MKNSLCMLIQSIDHLSLSASKHSPEDAEDLAHLHYEASRLNTNLLQLLSLYRAEKHQLPLTIEEHYIVDIVEELIAKNEVYIKNREIKVEINVDEDLAWYLDMDLIGNLLNDIFINALRYSNEKIIISGYEENGKLHIKLEDNGQGYPESMLDLVDMPMQQLDLNAGRTGLGLFFARLISSAHENKGERGEIRLENGGELGGSVFKLILP
ncbi:sensor histidine kinase [Catenovulum maritimum]|uniref:histidine kinase n=1 Tax=Catenovulum maritimum TaxID=1513271 RepID=A0A0J8JPP7_9ALTE|nr:HAMP domain-containing sensor histidine kinase [Catenovulum maritimum]KMT66631.1 ATPase [Catenovulum maritimum]